MQNIKANKKNNLNKSRIFRGIRKVRKFLFHPIAFIRDSWIFKYNPLGNLIRIKNLFVISHLGQLAQVESVIKKEQLLNCMLIIVYTNKNKKMPQLVRNNSDKNIFKEILFLELPSFPNKINIKNLIVINNSYREALKRVKPHRLFILSFEKHYCLLANRANEMNIEVNLIEEGTATYKYDNYHEANNKIMQSFSKSEQWKLFLIKTLPLFRELRPVYKIYNNFN
ncbi:polysialyltransferase family glycosyltransferase, partial [Avibacterium volantium]|uniref:polysialyltransferase family glycosyltransferase n=4 Tax=Avibacterium TaxID=292486 RepID=UPI003BF91CB7